MRIPLRAEALIKLKYNNLELARMIFASKTKCFVINTYIDQLVHVWVEENVSVRDPSTTHCTRVVSEFGDLDTFSSVVNYSFWRLLKVV